MINILKLICKAMMKIPNEFCQRAVTIKNFLQIFEHEASRLDKISQFFQVSIHFYPCHP